MPGPRARRLAVSTIAVLTAASGLGCPSDPITTDGQFGRPIALASGDPSLLPRVAFIDEGCPGEVAAGGCDASGDRACQPLLIDSLSPLTALKDDAAEGSRLSVECLEIRAAAGLAAATPDPSDLADAVARFRFHDLPLLRAPDEGGADWSWTAGNQQSAIEPAGVLGGNLLRNFAVAFRSPRLAEGDVPTVTFYREFPGSESDLAAQGYAFLPLQFPGRLLGRELTDRCQVEDGDCTLPGFDISTSAREIPIANTRMVMDACVALPPCALRFVPDAEDRFGVGTCELRRGPQSTVGCTDPRDPVLGGISASLVVATGVTDLVLFSDSATRMFGELGTIAPCPETISPQTEVDPELRVCHIADDGVLHLPGWPSAGTDGAPLTRLRVRSLALVPGATRSRSDGPCERAADRREALNLQCDRYHDVGLLSGDIRDAAPPYSAQRDDADGEDHADDPAASAIAVVGEPMLQEGATGPRPARWIPTTVLPADHPLVLALRRDVAPEALEPDGLIGTVLLPDTATVLDYTDLNPAVRVACLRPHEGRCQVLPDCRIDQDPACCHGLPRTMLDELIRTLDDDTCCGALSAQDLEEIQAAGHCEGVNPP